ncbi:hypothetical protein HZY83_07740 [Gemella sp. GH3]|uniref:hypothetical protein n=1 Tax=unclassified Gemella TaxID=2624949 RepID=UPI0015CFD2C3|nr:MULTISPECIES: hypothetical protein [unclassified Gemella]MBF0714565.1 hypothetical protein [Gemella sp. GH3.1]NYS51517.1 hypothetical protein [Gemella sp. GH3]
MKKINFNKTKQLFKMLSKTFINNIRYLFYIIITPLIAITIIYQIRLILILLFILKDNIPFNALNDFNSLNLEILGTISIISIGLFIFFTMLAFVVSLLIEVLGVNHKTIDKLFIKYTQLNFSISVITIIISSFTAVQIGIITAVITLYTILNNIQLPYSNKIKITKYTKPKYKILKNKNNNINKNK